MEIAHLIADLNAPKCWIVLTEWLKAPCVFVRLRFGAPTRPEFIRSWHCALAVTALVALAGAERVLWEGLRAWNSSDAILRIIDRRLLVLMLVEILHTVRISIHSHVLVTEPFLIVGLIAAIRRILVITLEAANLTCPETWVKGWRGNLSRFGHRTWPARSAGARPSNCDLLASSKSPRRGGAGWAISRRVTTRRHTTVGLLALRWKPKVPCS